jgi:hypothetical protein
MKRWFCMDCRNKVEIDRHGRCGTCDSEAVVLATAENDLNGSVSMAEMACSATQASV